MEAWKSIAEYLSGVPLATLLILILLGGYHQKWVWGWQVKALREDRDFWRSQALSALHIAERSTRTERQELPR